MNVYNAALLTIRVGYEKKVIECVSWFLNTLVCRKCLDKKMFCFIKSYTILTVEIIVGNFKKKVLADSKHKI